MFGWAHFYVYEYDSYGNWVKRVRTDKQPDKETKPDDVTGRVTYRVITYYGKK